MITRKLALVAGILIIMLGLTVGLVNAQKSKKSVKPKKNVKKVKVIKEIELTTDSEEFERKTPGKSGAQNNKQRKTGGSGLKATSQVKGSMNLKPKESKLEKAGSFTGDLRDLPNDKPEDIDRPEREAPKDPPIFYTPPKGILPEIISPPTKAEGVLVPAPAPSIQFDGLGRPPGNGFPPDTNGDVGPNYYIQSINTSLAIYNKTGGAAIASPSFNTFMSQGMFGNLCDTNNFGDPVVLYDSFEDRWIITDFAFTLDGSSNVINPPAAFQCFAVSKTGDPVAGGWYYYSIQITDTLNDYPKFGIWSDGLYMMANEFGLGGLSGSFNYVRAWAFNKQQMYAGAANPQIVTFDAPRVDY